VGFALGASKEKAKIDVGRQKCCLTLSVENGIQAKFTPSAGSPRELGRYLFELGGVRSVPSQINLYIRFSLAGWTTFAHDATAKFSPLLFETDDDFNH
jgi:hypothetical protein